MVLMQLRVNTASLQKDKSAKVSTADTDSLLLLRLRGNMPASIFQRFNS
jgi:hypothetical protein